jgi:phosphoribosylformylglycinamidine cyclo-ligase
VHITGGGLLENIPRVLPNGVGVEINKDSWPSLPVFDLMQSIGNVDETEMFRSFNMGIGMVFIADPNDVSNIKKVLKGLSSVFLIGSVINGDKDVIIK